MLYELLTSKEFSFVALHFFLLGFAAACCIMNLQVRKLKSKIKGLTRELNHQYEYNSSTTVAP